MGRFADAGALEFEDDPGEALRFSRGVPNRGNRSPFSTRFTEIDVVLAVSAELGQVIALKTPAMTQLAATAATL